VAVALHDPGLGALVTLGTDHRGRLGLDQLLQDHLHGVADHVHGLAGLQRIQHFEQGRLGQGHRV
jgi:hypothetical protein